MSEYEAEEKRRMRSEVRRIKCAARAEYRRRFALFRLAFPGPENAAFVIEMFESGVSLAQAKAAYVDRRERQLTQKRK
jgi:hypothetical protein